MKSKKKFFNPNRLISIAIGLNVIFIAIKYFQGYDFSLTEMLLIGNGLLLLALILSIGNIFSELRNISWIVESILSDKEGNYSGLLFPHLKKLLKIDKFYETYD